MESTGGMQKKSVVPSSRTAACPSLSLPFPRNFFGSTATTCKENGDQPQRSGLSAGVASRGGDDNMVMGGGASKGRGVGNVCDKNSSSLGNIADDICGTRMCYDGSSSHLPFNSHDDSGGGPSGSAIIDSSTGTPASGAGYSNPSFPRLLGGSTAGSTGHRNGAPGLSISCDNLSSLELEMTYDPHGCIYGPEGCLTPDSTWRKHLEFLAHIPGNY